MTFVVLLSISCLYFDLAYKLARYNIFINQSVVHEGVVNFFPWLGRFGYLYFVQCYNL